MSVDSADAPLLRLEEALGVPDLVAALGSMREVISWIRELPRNRQELDSAVRKLEADKSRLQKDLAASEGKSEERLRRLRDELEGLQVQLTEMRRGEGMGQHAGKHIAALEKAVAQERQERESALAVVAQLREDNSRLTRDLSEAQDQLASLRSGPSQVSQFALHECSYCSQC